MLRAIRVADRVVTFTHTDWSFRTCSRAFTPFCALIMLACTKPSNFLEKSTSSTKHPKSITLLTRPR